MPRGYSFVELVFTLGVAVTLGAAAAPQLQTTLDEVRAAGAVRFVSTRLQQARMEAIARSADVGFQFVLRGDGYTFAGFVDGNGNGVRTSDIEQGVDSRISPTERIPDRFRGVDFGVVAGLPPVDPGGAAPGADPIKLGTSNIVTFTPLGTSS